MSASRNSSAKFTLKASALSKHTVDFNKILEQVPVPKIGPLELVKPLEHSIKQDSETTTEKENTQKNVEPVKEFIFGEKLTDRVINVAPEESDKNEDETAGSQTSTKNSQNDTDKSQSESKTLWTNNENEADQIENNDANTILRQNCKLFVLETDKAKWIERGYGILKLIDSNDGINCKIMMWTDKCFRLILNTKLFEKMQIDRANSKSIRFNAYDNGSIRIFLIKIGNPNDCDELYSRLQMRFNEYLTQLEMSKQNSESKAEVSSSSQSSTENKNQKEILFKCSCDLTNSEESTPKESKIHLYNYVSNVSTLAENQPTSNSHQLLLDIVDTNNESTFYLTTYLKFIKAQKTDPVEFEINDSFLLPSNKTNSSKLKYKFVINDNESEEKFLSFYEKEPKFHLNADESSSEASDFNNSDEDNSDDEPVRKGDTTYESAKFTNSESDEENLEENRDKLNKKRKNNEQSSQEILNTKSFKKSESDFTNENESNSVESDLKRNLQSDDENSKEADGDQVFKKTKVSDELEDQQE